jgi:cytochrome c553
MLKRGFIVTRLPALLAAAVVTMTATNLALAGDPAKGKEKSAVCAACHGVDGNSAAPDFPKLAGQYRDYLAITMQHYKSGKRKNPIMAPMAANLTPEDIADLAAYFSIQTAGGVHNKY